MELFDKIVEFNKYCEKCKYEDCKSTDDPCNECLDNPTNYGTRKPVKYQEKETKKKDKKKEE